VEVVLAKHKVLSHHAPGETEENHKKHQAGHLSLGHTSMWDIDPAAEHRDTDPAAEHQDTDPAAKHWDIDPAAEHHQVHQDVP
jgi:hypothetical protein